MRRTKRLSKALLEDIERLQQTAFYKDYGKVTNPFRKYITDEEFLELEKEKVMSIAMRIYITFEEALWKHKTH